MPYDRTNETAEKMDSETLHPQMVLADEIHHSIADADDIEDADDEDDADDEEELTREEAMQYTLVELKGIAKDSGFAAADLKGLDKDGIIDLIFEDDDADDDTDEEVLTQDDLEGMSLAELKALCRDNGITVKRGSTQESLIEALVDADVVAA